MKYFLLFLAAVFSYTLFAQESGEEEAVRPVTNILSLRMGQGKVRNTYLTPLLYTGDNLSLEYQRWRLQKNRQWVNWQMADLSYVDAMDKGEHGDTYAGRLRYRYGVMHRWGMFCVGPYLGMDLGFDYNLKMASANNPATVRLAGNLGAIAAAVYDVRIRDLRLPLMLQVRAPFLGAAMMPEYGASYYETFSLNNSSRGHFTSLHNQQDLDVQLSADVPFALIPWFRSFDSVIRLGASYHIETMDINDITTRYSSLEFVIGWVYQYLPYGRHKSNFLKRQAYEAY